MECRILINVRTYEYYFMKVNIWQILIKERSMSFRRIIHSVKWVKEGCCCSTKFQLKLDSVSGNRDRLPSDAPGRVHDLLQGGDEHHGQARRDAAEVRPQNRARHHGRKDLFSFRCTKHNCLIAPDNGPEPLTVGHKEQSGLLVLFQYYLVVEVVLDGSDQCG